MSVYNITHEKNAVKEKVKNGVQKKRAAFVGFVREYGVTRIHKALTNGKIGLYNIDKEAGITDRRYPTC